MSGILKGLQCEGILRIEAGLTHRHKPIFKMYCEENKRRN